MNKVIEIFELIKNTSSRNKKEAIIRANADNELFKKCLVFLLDSNITTGISAKKINKHVEPSSELSPYYISQHSSFGEVMDYLQRNNTGTDDDIYEIQTFLSGQTEHREFYEEMITKKYRLGVDAKTVNKCIPELIRVHEVMLGTPIEKAKLKDGEWISLSHKLNGTRISWVDGEFKTRQGKTYTGLEHIKEDIEKLCDEFGYENIFLDGELLYKNEEGLSDSEAFQVGTGIANSKSGDKSKLKMVIFDIMPIDEFYTGKSKKTYKERSVDLRILECDIVNLKLENIDVVEIIYQGYDHSTIWSWLDYAEERDWEGLCLNTDAPYECKRTKNLLKVKKFFTLDLRCISVNIATSGKYKGVMGSVTCKYKGGTVDVGSGFTDTERMIYTANPEYIVDKVVEIKYKEVTKNKNGGKSLQFPVFQCVRDESDKDYADDEI